MAETATKTFKAFKLNTLGAKDISPVEKSLERPHPHQVVIKMKAASLNFRDLMVAKGIYGKIPVPIVPLSDGAGEVVEVGERVKKFKVGDRVCPAFMPDWTTGGPNADVGKTSLGAFVDGVLQEYTTFAESALVHIPNISPMKRRPRCHVRRSRHGTRFLSATTSNRDKQF